MLINKKKLNRVMLNEEGNKIDIKINRSNSRKELKKTNCTCSTLFVFLCRCFAPL